MEWNLELGNFEHGKQLGKSDRSPINGYPKQHSLNEKINYCQ